MTEWAINNYQQTYIKKFVILAQAGTTKCSAKLILMQPAIPTKALRLPVGLAMTIFGWE
jgi:hypothetical protein